MTEPVDETYVLPDGSTVGQLLAAVSGPHRGLLTWEAPPAGLSVTPPPSTTGLVLTATPDPTTVTFARSPQSDICGPSELSLSVGIRLVTDDGGFDETWTVLGKSSCATAPSEGIVSFDVDLRTTRPHGSFTVMYAGNEPWDSESLTLNVHMYTSARTFGNVWYITYKNDPDSGPTNPIAASLATWASPEPVDAGDTSADGAPPEDGTSAD